MEGDEEESELYSQRDNFHDSFWERLAAPMERDEEESELYYQRDSFYDNF